MKSMTFLSLKASSIVLLLIALCIELHGQGTFLFDNQAVNAPVFDGNGQPLAGINYAAELYGGPTSVSLTPTLDYFSQVRTITPFLSGVNAGYFQDGASHTVFGIPAGGYAWLQVRAWDARLGSTYEDVAALGIGGYGESVLFYADGGDPTIMQLPGLLVGLQSFSLRPVVPEPSALALLGLGSLSLWWAAHRKRGP